MFLIGLLDFIDKLSKPLFSVIMIYGLYLSQ